jgi:hypothetical protein
LNQHKNLDKTKLVSGPARCAGAVGVIEEAKRKKKAAAPMAKILK